jgi:hypothetical protein
MRKMRQFLALYWQAILSATVILGVVAGLLGFRLGTLTPGMSLAEIEFIESSQTYQQVIADPLNAPMKVPLLALHYFGQASALMTRAVAASYGIITIILFYFVMRQWHTRRAAMLTAFLFIVSSWFLQIARLALPYILFAFGVIVLVMAAGVLHDKQTSRVKVFISLLASGLLLYIPGMVWFLGLLGLWRVNLVRRVTQALSLWQKVTVGGLLLLISAPLLYSFSKDVSLVYDWLALPRDFIVLEWLRRILVLPIFLTAQGPLEPIYNLGRLPLLDVFTTVLGILGAYWYYFKTRLLRTQLLVLISAIATILIAFNGPTFLPLLLPLVFIVAGAGLTLLLQQWFTVFPRNPLARALGVVTISLVISITGMYHIRRYFVAWPGNPATRGEFIYLLDR